MATPIKGVESIELFPITTTGLMPTAAQLTGGIWTPGPVGKLEFGSFAAPIDQLVVNLAVKFTSAPFMGKKMVLNIVNMAIVFNFAGAFTRGAFVAMGFSGESMAAVDEANVAKSPWGWKIEEVLPAG